MIRNTQQASAPHFLPGVFFPFQNVPKQRQKRAPYVFDFLFLSPIEMDTMSISPHAIFLPDVTLYTKSLARLALGGRPHVVVPLRGSTIVSQPFFFFDVRFILRNSIFHFLTRSAIIYYVKIYLLISIFMQATR